MSVITFNYPWALLGFAIFIPLLLWDLSSSHRKQIQKNLPKNLRMRLGASRVLFRVFLVCIIIALSGPYWGTAPAAVSGETLRAADVVIALDVSRSMEIRDGRGAANGDGSTGEPAGISRLERGVAIVREAVSAAPGIRLGAAVSRNRGIVAVPLTWDLSTALTFLDAAGSSLTGRGTNLEALVDTAASAFQPSSPSTRVILLVSDGEELSGSLNAALGRCKRNGIAVSVVAVGSDEGGTLDDGEILSRRDSRAMRIAAGQTGGVYIDGNREDASRTLAGHLRSLAPGAETRGSQTERAPRWFLFVMLAIITFGASKLCLLRLGSGE
jgi:Ca-activated chloride channel family protein